MSWRDIDEAPHRHGAEEEWTPEWSEYFRSVLQRIRVEAPKQVTPKRLGCLAVGVTVIGIVLSYFRFRKR